MLLMFGCLLSMLSVWGQQSEAGRALSKEEVKDARQKVAAEWMEKMRNKHASAWKNLTFVHDSLKLYCACRDFGFIPSDGRSLYISMHGGGKAPADMNNGQWRNQLFLYQPAEGLYVAPRAPWDDSDMWHKAGLDEFLQELIQACVVFENVNPDKVYLLGYSAGGDGVWRMAPRMADHWAAASMMAGHPGNASQVNLRNLPYMIWMGGQDSAYHRNTLARERALVMDSLQQADPKGYIHESHILEDKGHWMDHADTAAISWMARYRRNPYPERVVWRQEEVVRPYFYWLGAPREELAHGKQIVATLHRDKNEVNIEKCDYSRITLYLNDEMLDLDKPVTIRHGGKKILRKKLKRTIETLKQTIDERGDYRYMFPVTVEISL